MIRGGRNLGEPVEWMSALLVGLASERQCATGPHIQASGIAPLTLWRRSPTSHNTGNTLLKTAHVPENVGRNKAGVLNYMCASHNKLILDLCGGTGSWSKPYRQAGYEVRVITLPENDVRLYSPPPNVYGILAAPPCTEFSFAKHFHGKGKYHHDYLSGLAVVDACLRIVWRCRETLRFWAVENPKGYLYKWLGEPALTFDPWEFGDGYQKRTCLWGSFQPPQRKPGAKPTIKFSMLKSNDIHPEYYGVLSRQERRAITPPCFAQAFFEANK